MNIALILLGILLFGLLSIIGLLMIHNSKLENQNFELQKNLSEIKKELDCIFDLYGRPE